MQITSVKSLIIPPLPPADMEGENKIFRRKIVTSPMIHGIHQAIIKSLIWINVLILCLYYFRNPLKAINGLKKISKRTKEIRGEHSILKYATTNGKYYFSFNAPGWPSTAFNKFVLNNTRKLVAFENVAAPDTIIFGITKKCGYQCEHCFEWEALNQPETLSRENILSVIQSFEKVGITQVQLSGGEPLNRFDDILFILQNIQKSTEVYLYTSGYHLTEARAAVLKAEGLTGVTISLDHWIPELHNNFRGKKNAFEWAKSAVANAVNKGLVVNLSLCATKTFITENNLSAYAQLAKDWGVSFIQVLEPKAVGHYAGKDVCLNEPLTDLLEKFYLIYNYNKAYLSYPGVIYHGFYSRRAGCKGAGKIYVYVDTDGDVHDCPFCKKKMFSALHGNIEENLRRMASAGCSAFFNQPQQKNYTHNQLYNSADTARKSCAQQL